MGDTTSCRFEEALSVYVFSMVQCEQIKKGYPSQEVIRDRSQETSQSRINFLY